MNLDEKIELMFFDPYKSRDEYIEYYKKICPGKFAEEGGRYRYSPVYLLFQDIHFSYGVGKVFNQIRKDPRFHEADFAGIILLRICLTNTVKRFYHGRLEAFASKYMGINDKDALDALNLLRNSLEHSYYSLSTTKVVEVKGIKKHIKVNFILGYFDQLILKATTLKDKSVEAYAINPRKLYTTVKEGMERFKTDLLDPKNQKLRETFDKNFDISEWVMTGP